MTYQMSATSPLVWDSRASKFLTYPSRNINIRSVLDIFSGFLSLVGNCLLVAAIYIGFFYSGNRTLGAMMRAALSVYFTTSDQQAGKSLKLG